MSRAFVKEDAEIPERSTRRRSASGLPPGAVNYMTAEGAKRLRARLSNLRSEPDNHDAEISRLERALSSATVVKPHALPDAAVFGSTVPVRTADGTLVTQRIVGVDEVDIHAGGASWISPLGKALLGTEVGQRLILDDATKMDATVVKIE